MIPILRFLLTMCRRVDGVKQRKGKVSILKEYPLKHEIGRKLDLLRLAYGRSCVSGNPLVPGTPGAVI